jgi:4-amino-4-deoxy-L-arabinose transferase-like glycosyltransferase
MNNVVLSSGGSRARFKMGLSQPLLIVSVLLLALFFRTYDLDRVPPGLDGDEMFNGWDALRVWEGKLTVYFPANYGREPLLIYLIALATRFLGMGAWTMRLPSVLCGIVGLAFTWALARRMFNSRVAILTTALMAVSLWPMMMNRVALRVGLLPACQAVAVYALWRAMGDDSGTSPGSTRWAIVAGLLTGLTLYTYTAGRVFPLVLLLWLFASWITGARLVRSSWKRLVLVSAVAALVVLPLGTFALRYPESFNQRMDDLSLELDQLLTGDPGPLYRSVKATLGMFTQVGDREWRYNPGGRPVFDPVTGALFYLGLLVCVFRLRRSAYLLLLIWLPIMLIPSIVSIGTPSFWRSAGALTPIYMMPAIGADFLWCWVVRRADRFDRRDLVARVGLPAIVVLGLGLAGADTWHDYFDEWARHPLVLHTYEADLAAAARYLNERAPAGTPVWVSSEFPGDLSRRVLKLQSSYEGPVRWFNGVHATIWPAGWADRDVLILYTRSAPPNPDGLAVLEDFLIHEERDGAGRSLLWVYRLPGEVLSSGMPWSPDDTREGRFAYNREILGYDVASQVDRDTDVPVVVYWRVPSDFEIDFEDTPRSFVCVQDETVGRCLDEVSHYMIYPQWDWTAGDVVAERYMVPVPPYLLPQTTYFHIGMFNSLGEISFADENRAGAPLLAGPVEVVGTARVEQKWDAETPTFNDDLALLDYGVPSKLSPGSTLEAGLEWQAMRTPNDDYGVRLELRDRAAGDTVLAVDELLGSERHPTSQWMDGEPAHTFHKVQIPPDLDSGEFDIVLALLNGASGEVVDSPLVLGTLAVSGRPHYFDLPRPEFALQADFGSGIRLLGFDLKQVAPSPGGQLEVVLYWQALSTISEDYKVFVHLYHPTIPGGLPGQHDSHPGNGAFPTSSWLRDEIVTDAHVMPIEPGAPVGVCKVGVGLYRPSTGERLPVRVDGEPQPDNALIIAEVEIR